MRYTRWLISFVILTMLVGLGSLMLSTGQVRALVGPCDIIIQKQADPADNTEFDFSVTGFITSNFTLKDGATELLIIGFEDKVTVLEEVPPGWILDENIVCSRLSLECGGPCFVITDAPNGRQFECLNNTHDLATVTCTFFNVREPTNVPTLSEWGLIALAGVLGIVGFMVIRRRKVTA